VSYREDFEREVDALKDEDFFTVVIKKVTAVAGRAWINDEPNPAFVDVLAAAMLAVDDAPEKIPNQRPLLESLRSAVQALHPFTFDEVFNTFEHATLGTVIRPDHMSQQDVIASIDKVIASLPAHRPPKTRERSIVEALARAFQDHSGYRSDENEGYRWNLLLFIAVFCYQNQIDVPYTKHDALLDYVPAALRRPFPGKK
jgi:hypothetical protein